MGVTGFYTFYEAVKILISLSAGKSVPERFSLLFAPVYSGIIIFFNPNTSEPAYSFFQGGGGSKKDSSGFFRKADSQ
jgi:hypothetical protein